MTRNHTVFLAALLGASGLSSMAYAQVCEDDFDCATGTLCVFEGGGDGDVAVDLPADAPVCDGDGCSEPEPGPTPTARTGKCEPLPKGLCVMQSDCSLGLTCEIGTIGTNCTEPAPIDQGGDGPDSKDECTPSEQPAPYGYCRLPETKCTTDAQCLLGLKCVGSSSGGTPGATDPACPSDEPECGAERDPSPAPAPEPKDAELTCQVAFDDCTTNSECAVGYACVERETGCSSSGSPGSGGGSVDPVAPDEPSAAIPKQNDPNCEYESQCLPKRVPCDNDTQCQSGWVCYEYEADSGVAEFLWDESGAGKACLPKGLALAAEASAAADLGAGNDSATGSPESGSDGEKSAGGGGGGGGMCSMATAQGNAGAFWLLVLSLGLVIRRRRA